MTCKICGEQMGEPDANLPKPEPLCGVKCMKVWCAQTGSEFLTIEEYSERRNRERESYSAN
jgi:hypothetical protein